MSHLDPEVIRAMRRFRGLLDAREAAAMREMAAVWAQMERALAERMAELSEEIADKLSSGQTVTADLVRLSKRYNDLQRQVQAQMANYASWAAGRVSDEQRWMARAGIEHAAAMLPLIGVAGGFDVMPVDALEMMVGYVADGSPLRAYFGRLYPTAVQGIMDALKLSIARGLGPRQTARALRDGMGVAARTAINSARTEPLRVYREASLQQYRTSGTVDGYLRVAAKSARTCMACLAKDGEWFPLSVAFEEHNQGRCRPIPARQGATYPGTRGLDWFREQPEKMQRMMLGRGRFEAWQANKFDLTDIAKLHEDAVWGNSWQERSLKELLSGGKSGGSVVVPAPLPPPTTLSRAPSGAKVSAALTIGTPRAASYKTSKTVLDAIDQVHGDGSLTVIPVKYGDMRTRYGHFKYTAGRSRSATEIKISLLDNDHVTNTLAHEIGHFLDFSRFAVNGQLTSDEALAGWRAAVTNSHMYQRLTELSVQGGRITLTTGDIKFVDSQYVRYLLRYDELWARSYAQYVATRSKSPRMLADLDALRGDKLIPTQWDDDDFALIADAMDALFIAIGWIA